MTDEIKVVDEEVLELWEKTASTKHKAEKLLVEANMYATRAVYFKSLFWDMVAEKYGINIRSVVWTYDEETQTVSRSKEEDERPLAKLLGGMSGISAENVVNGKDRSGTVI